MTLNLTVEVTFDIFVEGRIWNISAISFKKKTTHLFPKVFPTFFSLKKNKNKNTLCCAKERDLAMLVEGHIRKYLWSSFKIKGVV